MKARAKCPHDDRCIELVSMTPAAAGWGLATLELWRSDVDEFRVDHIAAWGLVELSCEEPGRRMVVPLISVDGALVPQIPPDLPEFDEAAPPRIVLTAIVQPGTKPIARHAGRFNWHLASERGTWVAGAQGEAAFETCPVAEGAAR
jgi:hypothetical protein